MGKILKSLGLLLLGVIAVLFARTILIPSKQIAPLPHTPETINADKVARDLSGAIPFRTVSWGPEGSDAQRHATEEAFVGFRAYLEKTFPQVYAKLDHEVIGANNLLFTWKGTDPSLKPILLLGHQDVVPIEDGTETRWTHPPFSGQLADGYGDSRYPRRQNGRHRPSRSRRSPSLQSIPTETHRHSRLWSR